MDEPDLTGEKPEKTPERDPKTGLFLPGNNGGMGRPKGSISITAKIKEALAEIPEGEKRTRLEQLVEKLLQKAISKGDFAAMKTIWAYIDGAPVQTQRIGGEDGGPLSVNLNLIPAKTLDQDTSSE